MQLIGRINKLLILPVNYISISNHIHVVELRKSYRPPLLLFWVRRDTADLWANNFAKEYMVRR